MADFDKSANQSKFEVVRYADDLLLLGQSRAEVEDGFEFIKDALKKIGHTVPCPGPNSKTIIVAARKPAEFLGLEIVFMETRGGYVCRIPKAVRCRVLEEIASDNTLEKALQGKETFASFSRRISGLPSSYRSAFGEAHDWSDFEPEIVRACSRALAGALESIFGDAVNKLDTRVRSFLGLDAIAP